MKSIHLTLLLLLLTAVGCGASPQSEAPRGAPVAQEKAGEPGGADGAPAPRKIIYNGTIQVTVEDLDKAQQQLEELLKEHQGYVAKAELTGAPGARRFGQWTVRVPVESFGAFHKGIASFGELQRNTVDAQDVTDQFYDLEARIKTRKVEEERLLKHMEEVKPNSKLEDILAVERELSRVRREIEQEQGQLQRLSKLTAYSTIVITIHERKASSASPSFGTSIARTFTGSLEILLEIGKFLVLCVVALLPWMVILAVFAVPLVFLVRRWARHARSHPPVTVEATPPVASANPS